MPPCDGTGEDDTGRPAAAALAVEVREGGLPHRFRTLCSCCGSPYAVMRILILLRAAPTRSDPICPDCVLSGPDGAAGRLRIRAKGSEASESMGVPGKRALEESEPWRRLLLSRAEVVERLGVFPVRAREAAVLETRAKR